MEVLIGTWYNINEASSIARFDANQVFTRSTLPVEMFNRTPANDLKVRPPCIFLPQKRVLKVVSENHHVHRASGISSSPPVAGTSPIFRQIWDFPAMFAGGKVPFETLSSAEHPDIPNEDPENRRFMYCMEEHIWLVVDLPLGKI